MLLILLAQLLAISALALLCRSQQWLGPQPQTEYEKIAAARAEGYRRGVLVALAAWALPSGAAIAWSGLRSLGWL